MQTSGKGSLALAARESEALSLNRYSVHASYYSLSFCFISFAFPSGKLLLGVSAHRSRSAAMQPCAVCLKSFPEKYGVC